MLGPPVDAFHVWVALGVVSLAFVAAALGVPGAPPPDAAAVADTVDAVAAQSHPTRAGHPVAADSLRVTPRRVGLRGDGGTSRATFARGPVAPATGDSRLRRVLHGVRPREVFDSRIEFARAAAAARREESQWVAVDDEVTVRALSWGDVDVVLVGA